MKKYTIEELVILNDKILECFYSWNQSILFYSRVFDYLARDQERPFADDFRAQYYRQKFLHEISEMFTFFYEHDDKKILDSFVSTEEERLKLKEVRHPIAHVDGNMDKTIQRDNDYLNVATSTGLIKDLITIIKYMRFILKTIGKEESFVKELQGILNLYPKDFVAPHIRKEILENQFD